MGLCKWYEWRRYIRYMQTPPRQLASVGHCDYFPWLGTTLSSNWKCLPQPPFPFPASSTRRVCPVTSPHLLGPAPGEAFTFLAFLLPLGAPAGAAWVREAAERRRRVGPLATSAALVGNERPLPCFSARKPGAAGTCMSELSHCALTVVFL